MCSISAHMTQIVLHRNHKLTSGLQQAAPMAVRFSYTESCRYRRDTGIEYELVCRGCMSVGADCIPPDMLDLPSAVPEGKIRDCGLTEDRIGSDQGAYGP
jgi:hypothetical protein